MNRSVGVLAVCGIVAMLGAGCGDDSGAETSSTETTISPMAALFGYEDETPEESRRKQLEVENLTAECMREEGWEYKPVDWAAQDFDQGQPDEEWGTEAFGKKYGYGIVFGYEQYEEAYLTNEGEEPQPGPEFVDPNQEYVMALSDAERQQYDESLYGEQTMDTAVGEDEATASTSMVYTPQGCSGRASEQVYASTDPTRDNPDLADRLNDFYTNMQEDPRIQTATEDWLVCITDKFGDIEINGKPPQSPDEMYSYVDTLKQEAMGLKVVPWDGTEEIENMYSGMPSEDGTGYAVVGQPEPIPEAELEKLRQTELDVWAKDHECQQKAKLQEIFTQIEQDFVDDLRAEFPELGSDS